MNDEICRFLEQHFGDAGQHVLRIGVNPITRNKALC